MAGDTDRPENAVACPTCGNEPGNSCDELKSHPSRLRAFEASTKLLPDPPVDWTVRDIKVTNRCGFCGDEFGVRAKHVCAKAAIDPVAGRMLTMVDPPSPPPDPHIHAPRIARTLREGVGNATRVCGCACGAEVMSAEAYADHVGWPIEAVRASLRLIGIADDLINHHDEMTRGEGRREIWQQMTRCLEVRR